MNSIPDLSKKTSINSLLNPEASSTPFSNQIPNLVQPHVQQVDAYSASFVNNSSFNLRAADWSVSDDMDKRKLENGVRHYDYADHVAPRMIRGREDVSSSYGIDGQMWQAQQQDVAYGAPVVTPMYSDERTALSGDYQSHHSYPQAYQDQSAPNMAHAWQLAERVSVRLAARGTVQETRYSDDSYYQSTSSGIYNPSVYQQQHEQEQSQTARLIQPPPNKRQQSEDEEVPAKAKRPKANKPPGPSKRGYNAKKRSEAAHIAAQNAQLMPSISYTALPSEKGKEKADNAPVRVVASTNQTNEGDALHPELQFARCMSGRYKNDLFPRCVSCTRRWAGDTCRFQGIRFFLKDGHKNIVGISFAEVQKADSPTMDFPTRWNVPLKSAHLKRTKRTIAETLLPTLRAELEHLKMSEIIYRPRESEVRATCDTCMTSIFSTSWMCRLCGREACAECFATVNDLTTDRPGASPVETAAVQMRREKHAHNNPFFLACTRRNEHQAKDFSPMSRFCKKELMGAITDMEKLLEGNGDEGEVSHDGAIATVDSVVQNGHGDKLDPGQNLLNDSMSATTLHPPMQALLNPITYNDSNSNSGDPSPHPDSTVPENLNQSPLLTSTPAYLPPNLSSTTLNTPSHPIDRYPDTMLTSDIFPSIWAKGAPLVVTDLRSKFKIDWTPEYFMEKYGSQSCLIIECQTDVNKRITVGEFFSGFGKYEGREACWKLKDWPPSTDFKSAFPELYDDFSEVVPVPNYVRRDGVLNIASHFPHNTIAPDLGPKMYNAMASSQAAGSKGSTRLHMDMADALNIMTYTAPCPDGTPGYAAWDLFRAEDSDKLREFLNERFGPGKAKTNGETGSKRTGHTQIDWAGINDPIHGQQFYLDEDLRANLYASKGVMSYRVYQRPGEAVFIPAGCAHQVANLADCVKVAVDFVSPENIQRCEKLTKEFREQNQRKVWKEDVLQLKTMMWFAWLSCCQQERRINVPKEQ